MYDTVLPAPRRYVARGATRVVRARSMTPTIVCLITCLISAFVILVVGLAMASLSLATWQVTVAVIVIGAFLTVWHIAMLARGAGRRDARTHPNIWVALIVVACFGLVSGFGLFKVLTSAIDANQIILLLAGIAGLVASLATYFRDAHIADGITSQESIHYTITDEPEPAEPAVARRALTSNLDLWEAPTQVIERPAPARRALEN